MHIKYCIFVQLFRALPYLLIHILSDMLNRIIHNIWNYENEAEWGKRNPVFPYYSARVQPFRFERFKLNPDIADPSLMGQKPRNVGLFPIYSDLPLYIGDPTFIETKTFSFDHYRIGCGSNHSIMVLKM